jgi:hypothetical protein
VQNGRLSPNRSPTNCRTFGAMVRHGKSVRLAIDSPLFARGHLSAHGAVLSPNGRLEKTAPSS